MLGSERRRLGKREQCRAEQQNHQARALHQPAEEQQPGESEQRKAGKDRDKEQDREAEPGDPHTRPGRADSQKNEHQPGRIKVNQRVEVGDRRK